MQSQTSHHTWVLMIMAAVVCVCIGMIQIAHLEMRHDEKRFSPPPHAELEPNKAAPSAPADPTLAADASHTLARTPAEVVGAAVAHSQGRGVKQAVATPRAAAAAGPPGSPDARVDPLPPVREAMSYAAATHKRARAAHHAHRTLEGAHKSLERFKSTAKARARAHGRAPGQLRAWVQGVRAQHAAAARGGGAAAHRQLAHARAAGARFEGAVTQQKYFTQPGRGARHLGWGYILKGNDLSGSDGLTFEDCAGNREKLGAQCEEKCKTTEECVAYTYHPEKGKCFLKSGIDGVGGGNCGWSDTCWFWGEVEKK